MKNFKHFILTRYNTQQIDGGYLCDDLNKARKWMEARAKLFEKTRESVLSQEGDFEWIISIDKRTPNDLVQQIVTDERMRIVNCDIRDVFHEIKVDAPWVITSRLDNDDIYLPGAVKAIQTSFSMKVIIIDIPYLIKSGNQLYTSDRPTPNSPFLSLVNRSKDPRNCYTRPHNKMMVTFRENNPIFTGRKELAYMVIHGANQKNRIPKNSKRVK
jgi:hypothetical protein